MLTFVERYGANNFSQNGEDGIIAECLERMNIQKGICAEFGAADGKFCSNTYYLLQQGWKGIMIESDPELFEKLINNTKGLKCVVVQGMVTPGNINSILTVKQDVLSIDTDGSNDYDCWKEYLGEANIVIIEINSSIDPLTEYINEGTSYRTMFELGIEKGYFLLCHTGNMVFIRNKFKDLFPEITGHPLIDIELYFNKSWL